MIISSRRSGGLNRRILFSVSFFAVAVLLGILSFGQAPQPGPNPSSGTLSTSNRSITYSDPVGGAPNPTAVGLGAPDCTAPNSCSIFMLTIDSSVGSAATGYDPAQNEILITETWGISTNDYDTFVEDSKGKVVAQNTSTADPETIHLQTNLPPGVYQVILVMATGSPVPYTGTIKLQAKPSSGPLCDPAKTDCTPPRYQSYPAGTGQADNAGEPSLGVDWNPNDATLKHDKVNTGGVAFFTSGSNEWRINFDDCSSPSIYKWEDVSATFTQTFVLSDPIGFVDHYSSMELGLGYPPPKTPGRVFTIDLIGGEGNSLGSYSDSDGKSYLPGGTGGPGAGPDHQTLGGGPYSSNQPAPISHPNYPNAIYYCSQNIAAEAQCSRSDDGGQTFGPGVPIYTPPQCTGGIHGHVKVAPDGTVYVPNSSCGTSGTAGAAVSTDNGLTWTENNVPNSTSTQDPSIGVGQNHVGKPAANLNGTNTVYVGYVDGDGHPKIAHSGDRGATWSTPADVGSAFRVTHAVFPVVVAGDDNRASFAFVGTGDGITAPGTTGTCDPFGATLNCANVWHLYVATTYDGGANWITTDATPDDPVQTGTVCLQGTTCAGGRNLLDFNDYAIDAQGRGLVGYADGCVSCSNEFKGQSSASHGTVTRQSGGRRLFSAFDPVEPAVPAAPQMLSASSQPTGVVVTWLEPDNGGSPITGYKIYRGGISGGETFLAEVSGETTLKYVDATPPTGDLFYYVQAVNAIGEGGHCRDLQASIMIAPNPCSFPGALVVSDLNPDGSDNDVAPNTPPDPRVNIRQLFIEEPYTGASGTLVFTMQMAPSPGATSAPPSSQWYIVWDRQKPDADYDRFYVAMKSDAAGAVSFDYGKFGVPTLTNPNVSTPLPIGPADKGTYNPSTGVITITLSTSKAENIQPGGTLPNVNVRTFLGRPDSGPKTQGSASDITVNGTYTVVGNQMCKPNTPPVAVLTATPQEGPAPLVVNFNGATSSDPDGGDSVISYTFNFGDGSPAVTQPTATILHTYTAPGNYPARLTVTDTHGAVSANTAQLIIGVDAILQNISTRAQVLTGDNVLIGGFIISGTTNKKVILRAIGPSLKVHDQPVAGAMQDPTLELHDPQNNVVATNDNWKLDDQTQQSQQAAVEGTGLAPSDDRESAIVRTLAPGNYTVILRGKGDTTGIALVEAYDLDSTGTPKLGNISTRGLVQTGDNVVIGGFFAGPKGVAATDVLIRGLGPSLSKYGVSNALQDPMIELHDGSGNKIASNDNWKSTQRAAIEATGLAPTDDHEAAFISDNLPAGPYTVFLSGVGATTGIGLVEIFNLP